MGKVLHEMGRSVFWYFGPVGFANQAMNSGALGQWGYFFKGEKLMSTVVRLFSASVQIQNVQQAACRGVKNDCLNFETKEKLHFS